jgi:dienelactone hydrolase
MRAWQGLATTHGFLVACPDMVTATDDRPATTTLPPAQEDDEVLLSIVEEVCERFRVNRRAVMVTGFSGGGNPSYHSGLRHPDVFTHICTRGGNFSPVQIPRDEATLAAGRSRLRIHIFFGERDHEWIVGPNGNDGQAHQARDALRAAGYEHILFEQVPGMGHESRPQKAAEWLAAWLEENRRALKDAEKADDALAKAREALAKDRVQEALKALAQVEALDEKAGLEPRAPAERAAIEERGRAELADAVRAHEAGETAAARSRVERVARQYKGLAVADEASRRLREWSGDGG